MIIQDIIDLLEELAPLSYAEDFDNVGLLVGNKNTQVQGILVTLDTLEAVIEEAIEKNCNLIVSFHPILFSGFKKITGETYVERVVTKAIQNNIAIFSMHTALDNAWNGVNAIICDKLGLINRKVLLPKKHTIKKLITYVPSAEAENLRNVLFEAGAGSIGNYNKCSFSVEGFGSFCPTENAHPSIGKIGKTHKEAETQIGVTFATHLESKILKALFKNHSYDEVAYEITTLENTNQKIGLGMLAELQKPMPEKEFLEFVKTTMQSECIKHSALLGKNIQKVAVLGGSGSFAIEKAKQAGADVFITADLKYHDFYKAENKILIADIGHYESEQFTKNSLVAFITKKITNFAPALNRIKVNISEVNTNPIKYL
ncbi:MAG: Nif3-like dinuclear metal center hexameric protein [Bacteroidetes bacterium HGW-Bacteroidetes-2]|jgi:dinuclear metal center YbgI/SA1388 family protein|nr:MAG: Nif3-like dinuclear metal center hexameric protein [Bacteroidetes bacterium HGW-Bacteroidetes-2]